MSRPTKKKGGKRNLPGRNRTRPSRKEPLVWESETLFRTLADTVQAAIFVFQGKKNMFLNSMAESITGYSAKELQALNFWDTIHPDFKEMVKERGLARQRGENVLSRYEVKIITKHGEERWLDFSGKVIEFGGKPAVMGTAIDITQSKRGEERIKALHEINLAVASSLDLRSALEILLEKIDLLLPYPAISAVSVCNPETGIIKAAAFRNISQKEWQAALPQEGIGLSKAMLEQLVPVAVTDAPNDPRTRYPDFLRQYGLVSYLGVPLITKGELLGGISLFTKEKHVFSDEEIEFFSSLGSQAAIAIYNSRLYEQMKRRTNELSALYSMAGIAAQFLEVGTLVHRSMQKILEIFGFDAGRIYFLDRHKGEVHLAAQEGLPRDFIPSNHYQRGEGFVGKVLETGEPLAFEDMQKDPEYHRLAQEKVMLKAGFRGSFFIPLRVRGETLGVMHFLNKHTRPFSPDDLRLINSIAYHLGIAFENAGLFDQLRKKTAELEKANKAKDEFLNVMSHELRTPLAVVEGYTAMMKDGFFGKTNDEQDKALANVMARSNDLLVLINSILDTTRIETGQINVTTDELNLADFLEDLKSIYRFPWKKEITLAWDYPPELPVVRTDRGRLKQILQNLINNAIKFTDHGNVTTSVRYFPERRRLEFKVKDTGIGIPQEALPVIFEKFRQMDSSETRVYEGVGLGLYIVRRFAELLGGDVRVESELGKGSVFTVTMPI